MNVDLKGDIYEGLLEKNAADIKSGAGQYFTPRPLIQAMVEVMQPQPEETICDPCCGTGGFFLGVHQFLSNPNNFKLDKEQKIFLQEEAFMGWEIVEAAARLCAMNLFLHGITGGKDDKGRYKTPINVQDALLEDPGQRFDLVLSNPPFGKKSSVTIMTEEGNTKRETQVYERKDFETDSSNKQLNFMQHIKTLLKINGRAAVVVPDNVLFEGGAGEKVRRAFLESCDVHTLLRLPTGLFYAQGVKANVIFFDKKPARGEGQDDPWTKELWIYDLRTNKHFTLKTKRMRYSDLEDFVECYKPGKRHERVESERFKRFTYEELSKRDKLSLDLFWLKDESLEESENLPEPDVLAEEIVGNLKGALELFEGVSESLGAES